MAKSPEKTETSNLFDRIETFINRKADVQLIKHDRDLLCIPDGMTVRPLEDILRPGLEDRPRIDHTIGSTSIKSLIEFVNTFGTDSTILTSSANQREYTAIINYHKSDKTNVSQYSIERCDWRFHLSLEYSPLWKRLTALEDEGANERPLFAWIRELGPDIEFVDKHKNIQSESLDDLIFSPASYELEENLEFIDEKSLVERLKSETGKADKSSFMLMVAIAVFETGPSIECPIVFEPVGDTTYTARVVASDIIERDSLEMVRRNITSKIPNNVNSYLQSEIQQLT